MKLLYTDYLELPAPLAEVYALLRAPDSWAGLPGVEPLGELWRCGSELYRVDLDAAPLGAAPPTLRVSARAALLGGPRLDLHLTLHDARISTHVTIDLALELPGMAWPWRRLALIRHLARTARACADTLSRALRAREVLTLAPALAAGGPAHHLLDDDLSATPAQRALVADLQQRYPLTVEHFRDMGALDHLERVARLEQGWERIMRGEFDADVHVLTDRLGRTTADDRRRAADDPRARSADDPRARRYAPAGLAQFDLIYAGGGLGLLHAAAMAMRYGRRVLVFDRGEIGCAHREWNISRDELAALVELGLASWDELDDIVMREYRDGLVRFYNGPANDLPGRDLWLPEVLNVALDAGALLRLMRRKLEAAGGVVLSGHSFRQVRAAADGSGVEVVLEPLAGGPAEHYRARLLLDGMGSTSPLALKRHAGRPFAGVCPTVGTVAAGFAQGAAPDEYDPTLGDILLSVADAQRGEQLMWEGFPGRADELTVYLFYYSTLETAGEGSASAGLRRGAPRYSLIDLFEQYFTLLPTYKRPGPDFHHTKPVYGYIPARHSLRRQEAPLLRGVLPVGDSAAQQSPLTFCGFGSHVRNLSRSTSLLDYALGRNLLEPQHLAAINAFQINVSLNWVFSRFMHPWSQAHDVNRLQNLFLEVLNKRGVEMATRFFRDRMRWSDYHPMILGVLRRYPRILLVSWWVLGPHGMLQWAADYLRFSAAGAAAALARATGPASERALTGLLDRLAPAVALRLRGAYAEWRAMGWL